MSTPLKRFAFFLLRLFFSVEVEGQPDDLKGPLVICANHSSNWDAFAMFCLTPDNTRIVAKKELSRVPVLGALFRRLPLIFVDRGASDMAALREMLKTVQEGGVLGIFPEGHRYHSVHPSHIKEGIGYLVQKSAAPVQCMYIDSDYKFRHTYRVVFRPMLMPESFASLGRREARGEITRMVFNTIYDLSLTKEEFQQMQSEEGEE